MVLHDIFTRLASCSSRRASMIWTSTCRERVMTLRARGARTARQGPTEEALIGGHSISGIRDPCLDTHRRLNITSFPQPNRNIPGQHFSVRTGLLTLWCGADAPGVLQGSRFSTRFCYGFCNYYDMLLSSLPVFRVLCLKPEISVYSWFGGASTF